MKTIPNKCSQVNDRIAFFNNFIQCMPLFRLQMLNSDVLNAMVPDCKKINQYHKTF